MNELCDAGPYYARLRLDVLAHVPQDVRQVLSTGCGAGATEAQLVRRGVAVTGIEKDANAADLAQKNGLEVLCGDAMLLRKELSGRSFDCLIYADVLEHFLDPEAVLRFHTELLRPGGTVVISVPNFRHVSVLYQLVVRGHVRYVDAGVLDRTHVRMTTRRMVEEWLSGAGLRCVDVDYQISRRRDALLSMCLFGLAREFFSIQVIVTAEKPLAP